MAMISFFRIGLMIVGAALIAGCFKSSAEKALANQGTYAITTRPGFGGSISPSEIRVQKGASTQLTITTDYGYKVENVVGCEGQFNGEIYTTGAMTKDCVVEVEFASSLPTSFIVASAAMNPYGTIHPRYVSVQAGMAAQFVVEPSVGYESVVTGCNGTLEGKYYTTNPIEQNCEVSVEFLSTLPYVFVITTTGNEGGMITPRTLSAQNGTEAQIIVEPYPGFVATAEGCGGTLIGHIYVTAPVTEACSIDVVFTSILPNNYLIHAYADDGGKVWPDLASAQEGSYVQFFIEPELGMAVKDVTGCPGELNGQIYIAGPVIADCQIDVVFKSDLPEHYIVTAKAEFGSGRITPEQASVQKGTVGQFHVEPFQGKSINTITGCGGKINHLTYTTAPITEACEVYVDFKDSLTLSTSVNYGGSISPEAVEMAPGGSTDFTILAFDGYEVVRVNGCGGTLNGNIYSVENVQSTCEVFVDFKRKDLFTLTAISSGAGTTTPAIVTREKGENVSFTLVPEPGYMTTSAHGCGGALSGNTYQVNNVAQNCEVTAVYALRPPPQNVAGVALGNASVRITYQPVPGATTHNIYISHDPGITPTSNYHDVWRGAPSHATITNVGVGNDIHYYYVVAAVFGTGPNAFIGPPSDRVVIYPY